MKKIVLVGELNEIVRELNECFSRDFQVQLCNEKIESVKGMVSIVKPDLVVISQISMEVLDYNIIEWLNENYKNPILIISAYATCTGPGYSLPSIISGIFIIAPPPTE